MHLKSTVQILPLNGRTLIWDRREDKKIIIHLDFDDVYSQLSEGISTNLLEKLKQYKLITSFNISTTKNISNDVDIPSYIYMCRYLDIHSMKVFLKNKGMIRIVNTIDNYILISPILYSQDEIDNYVVRVLSSSKFYRSYLEILKNQQKYPQLMSEKLFEAIEYRKIIIDFIRESIQKENMAGKIDIRTNEIKFTNYVSLPVIKGKIKEEWKWLFLM